MNDQQLIFEVYKNGKMNGEMILLRGIPGSGKSEFAHTYLAGNNTKFNNEVHVVEADQFFYNEQGEYNFNPSLLSQAHADCKKRAEQHIKNGDSVVVSNTFSQQWEMQPYIDMAKRYGIKIRILTVHGDYGSIHNVPRHVIKKMKERWERDPKI